MGLPANTMFGNPVVPLQPSSGMPQTPVPAEPTTIGGTVTVVDGTPMRVASIVILAGVGLAGLKWAGFKFNVTVGG